jgi:hypothetical protein
MSDVQAGTALATGLAMTDLTVWELWLRYLGLGGKQAYGDLQTYLAGETGWSATEHDVAAQALNEYFSDHDMDHPVRYASDL